MATDKPFMAYVAEQAQLGDALTYRKMFGEYGVYLDGKIIGLVCDNSLFLKTTDATTALTKALPLGPPYPGAKPYAIADQLLDDSDALQRLLIATADALPAPKPKAPRTRKKK